MISLELRKKLEMWSLIISLVVMTVVFILFVFLYVTTARQEGKSEMQNTKYKPFGVITHEDIYIDNRDPGSRYTSHGRLITKSE